MGNFFSKQVVFLLSFLVFPFSIFFAQEVALKGLVINSNSNEPLGGILVSIEDSGNATTTNEEGIFTLFHPLPLGEQILIFSGDGFHTKRFPVVIEDQKAKNLGIISLEPDIMESQMETGVLLLADHELDQEDGGFDNISGLLHATQDVFLSAAAFDFSSTFFRPRGLNSEHGKLLINGIEMNKIYDGRPQWSNWGGLNDVQRNQVFSPGFTPAEVSFGGAAGATNIIMRASEYTKGGKFSYARANRSYSGRIMGSYHTGLQPNGWAFSISASRRYSQESFREGTIYDANSVFLSTEKRISPAHSINFSSFFTPTRRGKTSANTQEVYDLKGIKYNAYWGYQNGEIRNSRVREISEPVFMLNHYWQLSEKSQLNTNLMYQFGRVANSRLDYGGSSLVKGPDGEQVYIGGGTNPDPTYYQYLPSYFLRFEDDPDYRNAYFARDNFIEEGQINWASLYSANRTQASTGGNALYILYEDRNDDRQYIANTIFRTDLSTHISLNAKLRFQGLISENYAAIIDLLGGNQFLDVDSFSEGEKAQSNLLNPNRLVREGEKFKYHYELSAEVYEAFVQAQFRYRKIDFYAGANLSRSHYQRFGYFKNGNFPDNSLGKSDDLSFTDYGLKAGSTYKVSGQHLILANAALLTKAPSHRNSFSNSRQNNDVVLNIQSEKISNIDLSYVFRTTFIPDIFHNLKMELKFHFIMQMD